MYFENGYITNLFFVAYAHTGLRNTYNTFHVIISNRANGKEGLQRTQLCLTRRLAISLV